MSKAASIYLYVNIQNDPRKTDTYNSIYNLSFNDINVKNKGLFNFSCVRENLQTSFTADTENVYHISKTNFQ